MVPIPRFKIVKEKTAAIIERLGRFHKVALPGFHILTPFDRVAGMVSLRVQEMNVHVETKTVDDVFVRLTVAVQYFVSPQSIREAFYELSNPVMQIESYVYDEVRAQVPKMKLDEVFQNKDDVADAVKTGLEETMDQYGYNIIRTLINDIDPDSKVKAAMNEINAAQRIRRASEERGEAEKILRVKQAEAEARSAILRGEGIAGQRKAIIDGLRQSVEEFQKGVPGTSASEVMQIVIMTQYFDTLKEIGAGSRSNTLMMPHTPGSISDFRQQVQEGVFLGNVSSDVAQSARSQPPPQPKKNEGASTTESGHRATEDRIREAASDLEATSPAGDWDPRDVAAPEDKGYPRTSPPRR